MGYSPLCDTVAHACAMKAKSVGVVRVCVPVCVCGVRAFILPCVCVLVLAQSQSSCCCQLNIYRQLQQMLRLHAKKKIV